MRTRHGRAGVPGPHGGLCARVLVGHISRRVWAGGREGGQGEVVQLCDSRSECFYSDYLPWVFFFSHVRTASLRVPVPM